MQTRSFLAPFLDPPSPKRFFQGLAVGVIGTIAIGFMWSGWHLSSTVDEMVEKASETAKVAALAPICASKFQTAALADNSLIVELKAVSSWQRDDYLKKAGWATFPGGDAPDNTVARACADLLKDTLK
jgi:hypothetical protein